MIRDSITKIVKVGTATCQWTKGSEAKVAPDSCGM